MFSRIKTYAPHTRKGRAAVALAAGAVLLAVGFIPAGIANAIANGEPVDEGHYRFSVKLTMTGIPKPDGGRRDSGCSGTLVADQWIVTAGHCFRDENGVRVERPVADLTTATVGSADLSHKKGQVAKVISVRQSPTADVAVAKLDRKIRGIKPLPIAWRPPRDGEIVRITGYGSVTAENPKPSDILMTGQMRVVTVGPSTIGLTGHAPARDTSPCPFDSGAGAFIEEDGRPIGLIGVDSDGPNCPHAEVETFARVDNLAPWVWSSLI